MGKWLWLAGLVIVVGAAIFGLVEWLHFARYLGELD